MRHGYGHAVAVAVAVAVAGLAHGDDFVYYHVLRERDQGQRGGGWDPGERGREGVKHTTRRRRGVCRPDRPRRSG